MYKPKKNMLRIFIYNFKIAYEAILQNKLRAMLTSLGIICGVASVIAMLAIGKGAQEEILEKMRLLGTNNIIVKPIIKTEKEKAAAEKDEEQKKEQKKFTPGLTLTDAESIKAIIPHVKYVSPEVVIETSAMRNGIKRNIELVGVYNIYFENNQFNLAEGSYFKDKNMKYSEQVCIIGAGIKTKLFPFDNPIGKTIKCGNLWMCVIGVLQERKISEENVKNLGIRDYNFDIYVPITTMLLRFTNRTLVTKKDISTRSDEFFGDNEKEDNTNQIDKIIVGVDNSEYINDVSAILARMFQRRHNQVLDYEIVVPELLLEQEQSTKRIFNIVLGAIASISLIVGGIGIMNIMLASVLERTKEIGVRMAVGAKQHDILLQFLSEAVAISLSGGFIGIILGFTLSFVIEKSTDIRTIISPLSVFVSFIVSISVGLIFGITPARRASKQNPIELLRYE